MTAAEVAETVASLDPVARMVLALATDVATLRARVEALEAEREHTKERLVVGEHGGAALREAIPRVRRAPVPTHGQGAKHDRMGLCICGATETESNGPRTTYACGGSDYDGLNARCPVVDRDWRAMQETKR